MAKQVGRVGSGQLGLQVNWVAGQNRSFLNGSIRLRVNWVASWVELTSIFQTNFFFFERYAICQFFMSSLTAIRFLLVILLPITTKHLT